MTDHIYVIFFIQILSAGFFTVANSGGVVCTPEDTCTVGGLGAHAVDPSDCHNYYVCIESDGEIIPSNQPVSCPFGKYYDYMTNECQNETQPCANPCANRDCKIECDPDQSGMIAVPGNCTYYYTCLPGQVPILIECPYHTPYFNGEECSEDKNLCCDICTPYCEKAYTETLDPYNCKAFYLCLEDKTMPAKDQWYECDDEMHFDSTKGRCVEDSILKPGCQNLCQ